MRDYQTGCVAPKRKFPGGRCLVAVLAIMVSNATLDAAERPNVVLVITDDQGYGDMSCHGNPIMKTPNLDLLHAQSVRLTNFHVDPTCSPTRSALMTGRYSCRTGVWHTIMGRSLLRRDEVTMADVFAASGYRTGIFGKWHLGDNYPYRPQDRGFHEVLTIGGGGVGQTPDFWGNDYFDDSFRHNGRIETYSGYCTDVFFTNAMKFIEANKSRPFFAYIPTNAPHSPYNIADSFSRPFRDQGVSPQRANFYGMITNIDENVGKLTKKLAELGLDQNTILIFMTDNGSAAGFDQKTGEGFNAGMRGMKGSAYDGGHRVPCFIRWPANLEGGRDVGRLTTHMDLMLTLIELCGMKRPESARLDGTSLVPLIQRPDSDWPDRTLVVQSHRIEHPLPWRQSAVMTDRWRLIDGKELFDMENDPGQKKDVAAARPDDVATLRAAYELWYADVSTRFSEYCEIAIGTEAENPTRLCCHDWHGEIAPSSQDMVERKMKANGFWSVQVDRDGMYEFTLRERPMEANHPIKATTARLSAAGRELELPVPSGATSVSFSLPLKAGSTRVQTWLSDEEGVSHGAFYVEVKRLP